MRTTTDRAAAALAAAEEIFADEMGAALSLSPAAKALLMVTIAAAIEAAIVEQRARLTPGVLAA
jgi:hypothetical protein